MYLKKGHKETSLKHLKERKLDMNEPERKHSLHLYLNDAGNELLEEKFKQSKIKSKSEFIRRLIIDGYIIEVNFSELNRYNFLLSNISNNINQIAHRINETRSIYKSDIDSVKEEMDKLWQQQKSMLSSLPWAKQ